MGIISKDLPNGEYVTLPTLQIVLAALGPLYTVHIVLYTTTMPLFQGFLNIHQNLEDGSN